MLLYMLLYNVYKYTITILYLVLCFIYVIYIYIIVIVYYIYYYIIILLYIYYYLLYIRYQILCVYIYILLSIICYLLFIIHVYYILDPQLVLQIYVPSTFERNLAQRAQHFNLIEFLLFKRFFETRTFFAPCGLHWFRFPSGLKMCPQYPLVCFSCALMRSQIGLNTKIPALKQFVKC